MAALRVDIYNGSLTAPSKMGKRVQNMIQNTALNNLTLPASMRPLNSWMAFRSYYKRMFADSQQKEISTSLQKLWSDDPFKAKWSMLAKVYSIIRDRVGKTKAPLGGFLDLACPYIGIIPTDEYLSKLHWQMFIRHGKKELRQTAEPNLFEMDGHIKYSNLSEADIISHCINHGYLSAARSVFDDMNDKGQRLMVSLPHFNPAREKVMFVQEAGRDPIVLAAHVYDLPLEHQFFNASAPDMVWTGRMTDIYQGPTRDG